MDDSRLVRIEDVLRDEIKESSGFRGEVRQFIRQSPESMRAAAAEAVTTHNDDKEAHPKQRLAFVFSIISLAIALMGPAVWDRFKSYMERTTPTADAAEMKR